MLWQELCDMFSLVPVISGTVGQVAGNNPIKRKKLSSEQYREYGAIQRTWGARLYGRRGEGIVESTE